MMEQWISLLFIPGCGFDTLYWRLREAGHFVQNFIELDFPTVTAKKCYQIKRNKVLLDKIHAEGENIKSCLSSSDSYLICRF